MEGHLGNTHALDGGPSVMPDFIIIGAMKCATSTLHDQLARIDGVSMSEPKEPNFFSDQEHWDKGLDWYESLFAQMPQGDLRGESSTHYTKLPTYPACAARLSEHVPDAKLIYIMRDPIDRIVSQYIHEWSQHVIAEDCPIDRAVRELPALVDYSRYAMQLAPYIERYGRGQVLPVFFERLMREPQREFERVGRFLGITAHMHWQEEAKNVSAQRQRMSPLLARMLNIRAVEVARRTLMPEKLRARIRTKWTMKERPRLSEDSKSWLHDQLDPEVARIGEWIGRPMSCATFRETVLEGETPEWSSGVAS
jgi:hypothetical protein